MSGIRIKVAGESESHNSSDRRIAGSEIRLAIVR